MRVPVRSPKQGEGSGHIRKGCAALVPGQQQIRLFSEHCGRLGERCSRELVLGRNVWVRCRFPSAIAPSQDPQAGTAPKFPLLTSTFFELPHVSSYFANGGGKYNENISSPIYRLLTRSFSRERDKPSTAWQKSSAHRLPTFHP